MGTAIFILDSFGLNTYQGTTTLSSGTLKAGNQNAFSPSSPISILNSGVLDLNGYNQSIISLSSPSTFALVSLGRGTLTLTGTVSTTYDGAVTGTGGLIFNENATFTLGGPSLNTYSGSTILNSGTLSAATAFVFSPNSGVVINDSATLDLNGNSQSIFSLSSSSPSSTVLLGGTVSNPNFAIMGNSNTTYAGNISGTGSLTQGGTGTLKLTGVYSYSGPTTVSAGKIIIDGPLTGNVNVLSGGSLGGTGPITGHVVIYDGGTDAPGDPVTQTIIGSYVQKPGSTLHIQVTSATSDLISVTGSPGTADIAGSTLLIEALRGGIYSPQSNTYTIITDTGGVFYPFGATIFPPIFTNPQVTYNFFNVQIIFGFGLPVSSCITGNALSLLNHLNANIGNSDVQEIAFDLLPSMLAGCPSYLGGLESISPARLAILSLSGLEMGFEFVQVLDNRVMINHFEHAQKSKGTALAFSGQSESLIVGNSDRVIPRGSVTQAGKRDKEWDFWADGFDNSLHGSKESQNPAFNTNLYGALFGLERFLQNGFIGIGAGTAYADVREEEDSGTGKIHDITGFIYGSGYWENWYFDLGVFGAYLNIESERDFLTSLARHAAESDHHAQQMTLHFATGYDFSTSWGTFEPFAQEDWTLQFEEKFEERGSLYNMRLSSRKLSTLRSEWGLHYYQSWQGSTVTGIVKETFSYINKAPFGVGKIKAALVGVPGSFSLDSYTTVGNLFHGGIQVFVTKQVGCCQPAPFFSLSYDGEIGSGYSSNAVQGMIGLYF